MSPLSAIWKYKSVRILIGALTLGASWALSLFVAKSKGKSEGKQEVKLEQAEEALEASDEARRIKDEVHKEVNAIPKDELDDVARKLGILRDD